MERLTLPTFRCPLTCHHLYLAFCFFTHLSSFLMDAYAGLSVDDLLDLPNDDFLSSSADFLLHHPSSSSAAEFEDSSNIPTNYSTDFTDIFRVPTEEAAELEWLSTYMDDSFTDFPASEIATASVDFHGRGRSKRSNGVDQGEVARRCTHCASEKTPQWRTGPMGPKTLCNACGVRYKSGRLVPEYRPAASPTFVLTQHSNSHRKVLELRRQKDVMQRQQMIGGVFNGCDEFLIHHRSSTTATI